MIVLSLFFEILEFISRISGVIYRIVSIDSCILDLGGVLINIYNIIDVFGLFVGLYILEIELFDGGIESKKIVI